jgi:tRNA A37 threonylcarbamoyltransferase TsaD
MSQSEHVEPSGFRGRPVCVVKGMDCSFSGILAQVDELVAPVSPTEARRSSRGQERRFATTARDAEIHMLMYAVSELAENDRRTGFELGLAAPEWS